jgi:hypothetical protein
MSLPTLELTWHFRPNRLVPQGVSALATNQAMLLDIIDSFISTTGWVDGNNSPVVPTNMGEVYYSSNGTVPGTGVAGDGVNHIATISDLVWGTAPSAHSWIVINFPALGWQLLISCENVGASGNLLTMIASPGPFSGGSATARPTAAIEVPGFANTTWGASVASAANLRLHVMKSTTGLNWRVFGCNGGAVNTTIFFEQVAEHNELWTTPVVLYAQGASAATSTLTTTLLNNAYNFQARGGGSAITLAASIPSVAGALLTASITSANGIDSTWPFIEHNLVSITASKNGKHGYLRDWWWIPTITANGTTAPTTPPPGHNQHEFVVFGATAHPWCSTPALVS